MSDDADPTLAVRQAADSELDADPGVRPQADAGDTAGASDQDAIEVITDEVRDDIRQGRIEDDVTHVLEERLDEQGVHLRPEVVDDLAEEIENDVSS